jgi:DNA (cytosine-5)-methyltransferase 1
VPSSAALTVKPGRAEVGPVETFHSNAGRIHRRIALRGGGVANSVIAPGGGRAGSRPSPEVAESAYLRQSAAPDFSMSATRVVRCVDLFAGCGGLSLGISEACRSLGFGFDVALAVDLDESALDVYAKNFVGAVTETVDVTKLFDGTFGSAPTKAERAIMKKTGVVDLVVGGPPCQGHSDFNNKTRRLDPKNELYFSMVRAVELLEPEHVVIENVPGASRDKGQVVQRSVDALIKLGYEVQFRVVDVSKIGVPQRRKRLLLIASNSSSPRIDELENLYSRPTRGIRWAIEDLVDTSSDSVFDEACGSAPATRRRIEFLFDNDLYDLPNSERPPCHSSGSHTYSSIYGRLHWDQPSQTVTTGFFCMCMGRYVHPSKRRTLTAHEAARLQFFPDYFDFSSVGRRGQLATMIGNAVPSRLSYVAALEMLR